MNLSPGDRAALEIGRLFMRAHAAEQQVLLLTAHLEKLEGEPEEKTPEEKPPEDKPAEKPGPSGS